MAHLLGPGWPAVRSRRREHPHVFAVEEQLKRRFTGRGVRTVDDLKLKETLLRDFPNTEAKGREELQREGEERANMLVFVRFDSVESQQEDIVPVRRR